MNLSINAKAFCGVSGNLPNPKTKACKKNRPSGLTYKPHTRSKRAYPTKLLKQVDKLRGEGKTYSEIALQIGVKNWRSMADAYRKYKKQIEIKL